MGIAYEQTVSHARINARAVRKSASIFPTSGCAAPNTRRAVRSVSAIVVSASRISSSVAAGFLDDGATLDDFREAVTTLEDTERIARRVLGAAHPITIGIGKALQRARKKLRARETPPPGSA